MWQRGYQPVRAFGESSEQLGRLLETRVPTPTACGRVHRTVDIAFPRDQMKIEDVYQYTSYRHAALTTLMAPLGPAKV